MIALPPQSPRAGEHKRWDKLVTLTPSDVCQRAVVDYYEVKEAYILNSLGRQYQFTPKDRQIVPYGAERIEADLLLSRFGDFFRLSSLWYLTGTKDIPLTQRLVPPEDLKEGQMFFKASHALPLNKLAAKFGADKEGFIQKGTALGGETMTFGDASIKLFPYPRIPIVLILWLVDDEFPARVSLLFDSSCEFHLPLDMNWTAAMMCVLMMLA
ncbi:MAG: DUF3786 domain-containing protein [Nitrospirae bacterium]|nr:DUF3786 domain-containing protein [Nitrospirota bacterium]